MPQERESHGIESAPSAVSAELTRPKVSEKTEPKTIAIATIEVTLGRKNATRYTPRRRMFWWSRKAMPSARQSIGTVERNQMMKVLPTAFQKRLSWTR